MNYLLEQQQQIYKDLFNINTDWNNYTIYYEHDNPPRSEWQFLSPLCRIRQQYNTTSESKLQNHTKNQKISRNYRKMQFLCSKCGIKLCNKDALVRHNNSQHGLRFECNKPYCQSTFTRKDNFRRHLISMHDLSPKSATDLAQRWTRTTNQKHSTHKSRIMEIQLKADLASRRSTHIPRRVKQFHTKPVVPGPVRHKTPRRLLYESTLRRSQKSYEWSLIENNSPPKQKNQPQKTFIRITPVQKIYIDEYQPAKNNASLTPDPEPLLSYDGIEIEIQTPDGTYTHSNLELLELLEDTA